MLVFEMVFIDCCNITDKVYRGWVGSRRRAIPSTVRQTAALCPRWSTETATVNLVDVDGCWQQSDTACSLKLISAPQWLHRPCSGLSWFYRVGKRPPVKADLDLATYSPVSGVSVWC